MAQTVAFTVGVGGIYPKFARLAASCFEACTGVRPFVLGEKEFSKSGYDHPAALRIDMFKIFDAECVVYFDADWLCLSRLDLGIIADRPELLACRDFILNADYPRQDNNVLSLDFLGNAIGEAEGDIDYSDIRAEYVDEVANFNGNSDPASRWINTGFMICNRMRHSSLFELARHLYLRGLGHHQKYYEQPSIQKAIAIAGAETSLLARKFNVLSNVEQRWPSTVVGLHVKPHAHPNLLSSLSSYRTPDEALHLVRSICL
nr:hypothetical protein [uncultured Rhodopila sp.]